jgi:hypothetical protein
MNTIGSKPGTSKNFEHLWIYRRCISPERHLALKTNANQEISGRNLFTTEIVGTYERVRTTTKDVDYRSLSCLVFFSTIFAES